MLARLERRASRGAAAKGLKSPGRRNGWSAGRRDAGGRRLLPALLAAPARPGATETQAAMETRAMPPVAVAAASSWPRAPPGGGCAARLALRRWLPALPGAAPAAAARGGATAAGEQSALDWMAWAGRGRRAAAALPARARGHRAPDHAARHDRRAPRWPAGPARRPDHRCSDWSCVLDSRDPHERVQRSWPVDAPRQPPSTDHLTRLHPRAARRMVLPQKICCAGMTARL